MAPLQYAVVIVLKRSCPAVSQICNFTRLPSNSIVRILKSIPMVVMKDGVNESSLNRKRQHDFPTPESPIRSSLIYWQRQPFSTAVRPPSAYPSSMNTYQKIVIPCARHYRLAFGFCFEGSCNNATVLQIKAVYRDTAPSRKGVDLNPANKMSFRSGLFF